jgi:hypothetical protein
MCLDPIQLAIVKVNYVSTFYSIKSQKAKGSKALLPQCLFSLCAQLQDAVSNLITVAAESAGAARKDMSGAMHVFVKVCACVRASACLFVCVHVHEYAFNS